MIDVRTTAYPALTHTREEDVLRIPAHSIVSLVDDPGVLRTLVYALGRAGVHSDDIEVVRNATVPRSGLIERLRRVVNGLGPETGLRAGYEAALHAGHALVIVRDLHARTEAHVREALLAHGAHSIHLYGRYTVTLLDA